MAAYPFCKMTTKELRRLLKDDRERDQCLKESFDDPVTDSQSIQLFRTNPTKQLPTKISTESR